MQICGANRWLSGMPRQLEFHEQTAIGCIRRPNGASMHADNALGDSKTKAGSVRARPIRGGDAVKWPEDVLEVRLRHAGTVIAHLDQGSGGRRSLPAHANLDLRMRFGVTDGVTNNVLNGPADLVRHPRRYARLHRAEANDARTRASFEIPVDGNLLQQARQINPFSCLTGIRAAFDARKGEQLGNQSV